MAVELPPFRHTPIEGWRWRKLADDMKHMTQQFELPLGEPAIQVAEVSGYNLDELLHRVRSTGGRVLSIFVVGAAGYSVHWEAGHRAPDIEDAISAAKR